VLLALAGIALPWPARIAPVLLAAGLLWGGIGLKARPLAYGLILAGVILLAQYATFTLYQQGTARSHELPWPFPSLLAAVVRLLGIPAAADGSDLVLPTMRVNHRLGATWDLFLDPVTWSFLTAAVAVFAMERLSLGDGASLGAAGKEARSTSSGQELGLSAGRRRRGQPNADAKAGERGPWPVVDPFAQRLMLLLAAAAVWLPMRAGLHAGLLLHRALRTEYDAPLNFMNQFWSPWPQLLLLVPLVMLLMRWQEGLRLSMRAFEPSRQPGALRWRYAAPALGASAATGMLLTLAVWWEPAGSLKPGRIAVDERHSKWEPTERPFDTEWYGHLSGYNYACLYDFSSRYYQMSRLTNTLNDAALAALDVLILKVPTEKIESDEVDAIVRFVGRGGGLLLVGEHTDVFGTSYNLNRVARRFGFHYRYDCLFGMDSFFDQYYRTPRLRHPALENLLDFDFATSCSIEPAAAGRGVIVCSGLKNSMADYHANNYYPQAVDHAGMRAGAFVQLWSTHHGRGRVLAFTDSTIFSNFSTFEPGKMELWLGMMDWLNRQSRWGQPRPVLLSLGLLAALGALGAALRQPGLAIGMTVLATGAFGATAALVMALQADTFSAPSPIRPLTWVTIDRTLCSGPLSKGGFIAGKPDGFGIFERWILRLGYFLKRRSGPDSVQGDLIVFCYPTQAPTPEYLQRLTAYVEGGGKVLVLDSPKNEKSTAAALLAPFQLVVKPNSELTGTLRGPSSWPSVPVEAAHEITGGEPVFRVKDKPVAAVARKGKGQVVAVGFGSRWADANMGVTGDVVPDAELRQVFELQFNLLRAVVEGNLK